MTTTIDVNEAFAAEKANQLAERRAARDAAIKAETDKTAWIENEVTGGRMVQVGPDRYRVTTGWDAGEEFTVSRNLAGQIAEVVAEHGLEETASGRVALYAAAPAWHGLGQIIPGGTSDIDEVLTLAGLDFTVTTVPALYEWNDQTRQHEGRFHTVREDTGAALGVVGAQYTPVQNRQGFEFLQELVNRSDVVWESAGLLRGGRRVFISIRLPENVTVDAGGINDQVIPYVAVMNDHSGAGSFQCVVTPWRSVCKNTERFAVRDAHTRWAVRHTKGVTNQIAEARRTLGLTVTYFEKFAAEETALARTEMTLREFHAVIDGLWEPVGEDAATRSLNCARERNESLRGLFAREVERVGRTGYAAERAITAYIDHATPRRVPQTMTEELHRASIALEGTDDQLKSAAHQRLMLLTRR